MFNTVPLYRRTARSCCAGSSGDGFLRHPAPEMHKQQQADLEAIPEEEAEAAGI
jgi:hypothetical protein